MEAMNLIHFFPFTYLGYNFLAMHHDKFVFCVAVIGSCILQIWAENPMENGKIISDFCNNFFQFMILI